jgi:hypothetical protein
VQWANIALCSQEIKNPEIVAKADKFPGGNDAFVVNFGDPTASQKCQ